MSRAWRYIAIGVACYIPFLLVTFPVERLTGAVESRVDGLSIQAVTGSVFSGRAGSVQYQGSDYGPVNWRFSPAGLLHGRLEYRLDLQNPAHRGQATVGIATDGSITARDVDLELLPDRLVNAFSPMAISSAGRLQLRLTRLVVRDGAAEDLDGLLDWQAAELLEPLQLPLGDLRCTLASDTSGVIAHIVEGGNLGASGDITLGQDGRYRVQLQLRPGPGVDANTRSLLETMTRARSDGSFLVSATGRF